MRGKEAASAANRRAATAAEQVMALTSELADEKAARRSDVVGHAAALARLQAEIRDRAAEMAAETIEHTIETEVAHRVAINLRSTNEARAREVFALLSRIIPLDAQIRSGKDDELLQLGRVLDASHLAGELTEILSRDATGTRGARRLNGERVGKTIERGRAKLATDPVSVAQRRKRPLGIGLQGGLL